jgi:hypothetical protein
MLRKTLAILISAAFALSLNAAPGTSPTVSKLSAAEIVDKNVAARGGLQAWRGVQTVLPQRPIEEVQLPFVMDLARPHKLRLELQFKGQTAIQVYDGTKGWKVRPFLNRMEVEPYTEEEAKIASAQQDLDGPLVDYAAKGTPFVLETRVLPVAKTALGVRDTPVPPEKIILEKVTVNPKLDDAHFSRPQVGVASKTK